MNFQRARSEDQIQKRISEIVNAASVIYDNGGYEALNFSKISEYTQFTRPTIYKYFSTKEEILLKLMLSDMGDWIDQLMSSFKINKLYTIEEVAEILSHTLSNASRLVELFTILFTIIEKNVSKESLIAFKTTMFGYQSVLLDLFSQLFPKASQEQTDHFIETLLSLAIGLYPMCHLSNTQFEAICSLFDNYTPPEFKKLYRQNIYQILYCLQNDIHID
ncbi:TetR family transcriptional regulator [Fusibacter ferrireducens]|uniref:TetR family transcriptional regulator n=1 Tax=Fusibacter ferrireducens TaxID=2785058 RepID=A0ABR9ZPM7_9FIRM|nr:TetR family transcriptional regulator [Fusibacter ferrireducens]MBF4692410.1 TetR family transcriptional regulator [Fusibacter ferrireducens]